MNSVAEQESKKYLTKGNINHPSRATMSMNVFSLINCDIINVTDFALEIGDCNNWNVINSRFKHAILLSFNVTVFHVDSSIP